MRIGELAGRTGSSVRSLRYYEQQQGLLTSTRGPNGYREYDETAVDLVREIRSLLAVGFDLAQARPFVDCVRAGITPRGACPGGADAYRRSNWVYLVAVPTGNTDTIEVRFVVPVGSEVAREAAAALRSTYAAALVDPEDRHRERLVVSVQSQSQARSEQLRQWARQLYAEFRAC